MPRCNFSLAYIGEEQGQQGRGWNPWLMNGTDWGGDGRFFLFGFCIAMCLIMIIFANAMAMRRGLLSRYFKANYICL